jgi:opacity protein-like surface antigen
MRIGRTAALAAALTLAASAPAFADIVAFIGPNTTPSSRLTKGIGVGASFVIAGFELEYSVTGDDPAKGAPSLKTGMANAFVQSPLPILGFQPYATIGAGFFKETLGAHDESGTGMNIGGGVKYSLSGPLQLRADYRVFKLGSGALYTPAHRVYVGLNLKF